jgi:OmpA-OmpF porin, OOP family
MISPHKVLTCTALAALLFAHAATAGDFAEKRFYVAPFVGWTFFDGDRHFASGQKLNDDVYFGGRAGALLTHALWFDLAGGYTGTKDCASCTESWTHFSGNLMLSRASSRLINPFVSLGGGWSTFKHAIGASENSGTFEAAGGLRVRLSDVLGIRLEARNVLALSKSGNSNARMDDIVVGAGLTVAFGGKSQGGDSDGDGISNDRDNCPDTPRGCKVDAHGCPIDSDGDGVCDGRDKCGTTTSGCMVDENGCPLDADGDGVCDGLDQCPGTPANTLVKADGCPLIADVNHLEMELLNTGMIRLSNVNFDFDKSDIRPDAYAVLDTVGRVLTKWPGLRIEIGAYTDSRGTEVYNYALSHRRAESVRAYLLEHFKQFEPAQLTAKDFGESNPLVSNTSEANMQVNRRVEFVVLNREILKRQK